MKDMTMIKTNKTSARLLLNTLMLGGALMLAACQTTGSTGVGADKTADPVDAALQRAQTEGRTGATDSLPAIERLYKQDSTNPKIAVRYARVLRDNGRMTRAAMVLNPLIENPKTKTVDVITEYAAVQASMGNYEAAEKHARAAVLQDQNSAEAYHVLGIALDAQGFNKQAEVAFRKALDNWSGDPSPVLNNLGLNLAAQGFLDESISTLRRAAALAPNKTEIERNLRIVQALQVQPGTNTTPYAQTKNDQEAAKRKTAATAPVKAAPLKTEATKTEAVKAETAKAETKTTAPDKKKAEIVVEELKAADKTSSEKTAPDKTPTATTTPAAATKATTTARPYSVNQ